MKLKSSSGVLAPVEHAGWLTPARELRTFDPSLNLQRESVYLKTVDVPTFRIWRSTDSVVLGRFLVPVNEVHLARARELEVPVFHRVSGGGAVFHDLGNINYSIYLPQGYATGFGVERSLKVFSFPVTGLLDSLGVRWTWEPPNNIYALGRKISGSAQARSGGRLLHHGTLLVHTDLDKMCQLLKPGGRSSIAPVVNLSEIVSDITVAEIVEILETTLGQMPTG